MAYADDIVLLTRSKRELIDVTGRLLLVAIKYGLSVNEEKTKYMRWTDGDMAEQGFSVVKDLQKCHSLNIWARLLPEIQIIERKLKLD